MPNTNLENSKINMKTRIRNRVQAGQTPRDLGRLAKSARFVGLTDDAEVETDIDTQMAAAIPTASVDDLVEMSEGLKELRTGAADMGRVSTSDNVTEGGNKFLKAANVQPALSVSGDLSYDSGVVSYTAPTAAALQVVATVGDLPTGASPGAQAVVQSNNKLYIRTADGWYAVALINTAPTVSGNDATYTLATDGSPTVITLTAVDPENDPVTFSHSVTSGDLNGTTVDQTDNVFTVTPHASNAATFEITFSANDTVNVATVVSSFTLEFVVDFDYTNTSPIIFTGDPVATGSEEMFGNKGITQPGGNILVTTRWKNSVATGMEVEGYDISDLNNINKVWTQYDFSPINHYRPFLDVTDTLFVERTDVWGDESEKRFLKFRRFSDGGIEHTLDLGWRDSSGNTAYTPQSGYGTTIKKPDSYKFSSDGQRIYVGYYNSLTDIENINSGKGLPVEEYEISTGNLLGTFDYPGGWTSKPSGGHNLYYGTIAAAENWVAVGALGDSSDDNGPQSKSEQSGRIYIFDSTTRNHIGTINSPVASQAYNNLIGFGGGGDSLYGNYLLESALNGNYLITKHHDPLSGLSAHQGKVHIYDMSDPTSPSLLASIPSATNTDGNFNANVHGISGDYLVIGYHTNTNTTRRDFMVIKISTQETVFTRTNVTPGGFGMLDLTSDGTIVVGDGAANSQGFTQENYSWIYDQKYGRVVFYPANT